MKAVIFDLDGTLLNTLEDLTDAVNAALQAYELPVRSIEEVRNFVGNGIRNLMLRAVGKEDYPQFEELFAFFRTYYAENYNCKTCPYGDILELLETLKKRQIKMAIVSNKVDTAVKSLSDQYFSDYIELAIGEREGIRRKPAPDSLNEVLSTLGISKEEALYVGDSDVDIQTAENANMRCISVSWGFRDAKFLKEHGAEHIIKKPMELLEYM